MNIYAFATISFLFRPEIYGEEGTWSQNERARGDPPAHLSSGNSFLRESGDVELNNWH